VVLPWGSRSSTSTASPARARYVERFTTVVVLPTPPFWLAMAMTLAKNPSEIAIVESGMYQILFGECNMFHVEQIRFAS